MSIGPSGRSGCSSGAGGVPSGTDQERDQATGLPVWTVHCMVATGERPGLIAVRVPSATCPEPPALSPVAFERLEATARVNRSTGQLAVYWNAAGLAQGHRAHKQDAA